MRKYWYYQILLLLILILSAYLRFSGVMTNSFAFTYDVGRDMLKVAEIVNQHKVFLIGFTTGIEGIFYGPWWYYILALPFFVSEGNPQFIAGFMALSGVATVLLFYYFGKKLEDIKLGIIFAFLSGFSTVFIGISAQIWNPNIAPVLILLIFLLVRKIFTKPSVLTFFLFGVLSSLLIDTEIVFGILFLIGSCLALFIISKKTVLSKKALWFFPGALVIFLPRIIFEFRHQFLMSNNLINFLTGQKEPGVNIDIALVFNKLNIFLGQYIETIASGSKMLGVIILIFVVIFLYVNYKKLKSLTQKFVLTSGIIIVVFLAGIIFFSHDIWPHYLIGLPVLYVFLTGAAAYYASKKIKYGNSILLILFIILFWFNINPSQILSNMDKPIWEGDAAVYRNQLAVVDYIYKEARGKPFNYIAYSPAVFAYPYDYLLYWYGEKKYKYTPSQKHEKLFFVIIEPEHQRPELLKEWFRIREMDGKIKSDRVIKGGIRVQRREH